jgi:hypothetical protein
LVPALPSGKFSDFTVVEENSEKIVRPRYPAVMAMSWLLPALLCVVVNSVFGGEIGPDDPQVSIAVSVNNQIENTEFRLDDSGVHINAHGGAILFHDGKYYWFGEARAWPAPGERWAAMPGVACYESSDLLRWKNLGMAFAVDTEDPASDVTLGCTIERPKVVYNASTKQFVMWFHLELKGKSYSAARCAIAIASRPEGPYRFVRSERPNAGRWPEDLAPEFREPLARDAAEAMIKQMGRGNALVAGAYARRDFEGGQMSRDLTVFVDPDDAKAYLVSASEENYTLAVHELTEDYLGFTGRWTRIAPGGHNEAPAIIKRQGKYHLLASGCTGWTPNEARSYIADSMFGPWRAQTNPCHGMNPFNNMGPEKTFGGQSTSILPVPGNPGAFIAMFDRWRPRTLPDSGHIWLPVEFEGDQMIIRWRDAWRLEGGDSRGQ